MTVYSVSMILGLHGLEARWIERYNELMQYKSVKGHCNVPVHCPEHPQEHGLKHNAFNSKGQHS